MTETKNTNVTAAQEAPKANTVPKRILNSLLASVSAGVVPRTGAPYIAIGRKDEIAAFLSDLESVSEGNGAIRFLVGRYGSGKSFLIQLIRGYALERDFITADADLSPERRLYGSGGSGLATYRELIRNLASKSSPDGAALPKIIARWISSMQTDIVASGICAETPAFDAELNRRINAILGDMEYLVGGFDFTRIIVAYYHAYADGDDEKKSACMKWLRGEYATKSEAKKELDFPVSVIIDDSNWYDFIKLWAALVRKIGYRGLIVFIDECVNLYKITNRVSRENNYEKILSMFNDTLQGRAPGLEIVFGGTPQFLEDTRRGLFSYEALRSRLCDSRFALDGFKNTAGPVIRLRRLTDEELFALVARITSLYSQYYSWEANITDGEMLRFLSVCLERAGSDIMVTPRDILRDYMTVLNILRQNENASFDDVVKSSVTIKAGQNSGDGDSGSESGKATGNAENERKLFSPEDIEF